MNISLQTSRREYNDFFKGTVLPILGLSEEASSDLGFLEIAQRIDKGPIKEKYRRLAIQLLEENLREHQAERPSAIEFIRRKENFRTVRVGEGLPMFGKRLFGSLSHCNDSSP